MSPQKQASQIANAALSTGPRTAQGKFLSSANSFRHGLASQKLHPISPKDQPDFDRHCAEILAALAPVGAFERRLADAIVLDQWRLTRARILENEIFAQGFERAENPDFAGAETWTAHAKNLALLTLYEQRINRALTRNTAEFGLLQTTRRAADASPTPSAEPSVPAPSANSPENTPETAGTPAQTTTEPPVGFVHSSMPAPAAIPLPGPVDSTPEALEALPNPSETMQHAA